MPYSDRIESEKKIPINFLIPDLLLILDFHFDRIVVFFNDPVSYEY